MLYELLLPSLSKTSTQILYRVSGLSPLIVYEDRLVERPHSKISPPISLCHFTLYRSSPCEVPPGSVARVQLIEILLCVMVPGKMSGIDIRGGVSSFCAHALLIAATNISSIIEILKVSLVFIIFCFFINIELFVIIFESFFILQR